MDKRTLDFFKLFLPFAIVITALSGLVYVTVQQSYRQSANDPQIQIAEDIASLISQGQDPRYYIPQGKVDISKSLATYVMFFDKNATLIGSSAQLDNKTPALPQGVLESARKEGETRITWQPKPNVRSAIVVKSYKTGYIVVGRSLREVEIRVDNLTKTVFAAWFLSLLVTGLSLYIFGKKK